MPKTNVATLFAKGQRDMRRLLRGGLAGAHGDLRLRAIDDDDDRDDLNNDADERDGKDDDDTSRATLVATFEANHFANRDRIGRLQIYRRNGDD